MILSQAPLKGDFQNPLNAIEAHNTSKAHKPLLSRHEVGMAWTQKLKKEPDKHMAPNKFGGVPKGI